MMRWVWAVVSVTVATGWVVSEGHEEAGAATADRCALRGARILDASAETVVYRRRPRPRNPGTYGCARSVGRNRWLGDGRGFERFLGPLALSGEKVAYGLTLYENSRGDLGEHRVRVLNLRTGRLVFQAGATALPDPETPRGAFGVRDVALTRGGAVAWIAGDVNTVPTTFEVWVADRSGTRMVARGQDVSPTSLAVSGNRVYWHAGGAAVATTVSGAVG